MRLPGESLDPSPTSLDALHRADRVPDLRGRIVGWFPMGHFGQLLALHRQTWRPPVQGSLDPWTPALDPHVPGSPVPTKRCSMSVSDDGAGRAFAQNRFTLRNVTEHSNKKGSRKERRRGGGRLWDPTVCVPKMAQQNIPGLISFPAELWSGGGGADPIILRLTPPRGGGPKQSLHHINQTIIQTGKIYSSSRPHLKRTTRGP